MVLPWLHVKLKKKCLGWRTWRNCPLYPPQFQPWVWHWWSAFLSNLLTFDAAALHPAGQGQSQCAAFLPNRTASLRFVNRKTYGERRGEEGLWHLPFFNMANNISGPLGLCANWIFLTQRGRFHIAVQCTEYRNRNRMAFSSGNITTRYLRMWWIPWKSIVELDLVGKNIFLRTVASAVY